MAKPRNNCNFKGLSELGLGAAVRRDVVIKALDCPWKDAYVERP
jgi:hypothetical protein